MPQQPPQPSVGKPMVRVDGRAKVTGTAKYAAEFTVPHLCHGVMVTSTIAKGRIDGIDTQAAASHPGVLKILTHQNTPKLPEKPAASDANRSSARKVQLLQNPTVLYANQPVALVIAESLESAREA